MTDDRNTFPEPYGCRDPRPYGWHFYGEAGHRAVMREAQRDIDMGLEALAEYRRRGGKPLDEVMQQLGMR